MKTVAFFTASNAPTAAESAAIASLNEKVRQSVGIVVLAANEATNYGSNQPTYDYAMGSPPDAFKSLPTFTDADAMGLTASQIVVNDGTSVVTADGGTVTLSVADGKLSATYKAKAA